jgi:signal transduction histidine kinase
VEAPATGRALEELVREHAALRRVATLVARETSPADLFGAVTRETGELLSAQRTSLLRVESPESARVVAAWSNGEAPPVPVGHRGAIDEGVGILGRMLQHPRPVRIEDFDEVGGAVAELMRDLGIRAAAGGPILLGGRLWGAVAATWPDPALMPAGAEDRVAAFAELVAYAIESAEAREELAASRARLVEAADEARRRIERDLHDGAQQRLVAAALELTILDQRLDRDPVEARVVLSRARQHLELGLGELRDLARGIHPAVLTERGLAAAVVALVQRAPVPVELEVDVPERLDAGIEAAAYFVVSEALANVAKYAEAETATVRVVSATGSLQVTIADDGIGGAEPERGSGLRGLADRVAAVGGLLEVTSPAGEGTQVSARLPATVLGSLNGH